MDQGHNFAFPFLSEIAPPSAICTNVWEQWKRSRRVNAKREHTAIELFWVLNYYLLFWQWKGVRWVRRLPKPHAEVKPKTEYVQGIFHSVALWWTSGRGTLPWQDHRWRRANCPRDGNCRLQGQKSAVTSAGPSDGSRTSICVRCGNSMTGSLYPPHRHSADECALAPSNPQTALGNGQFPRWVPLWEEQRHWQKASAMVCQALCAVLHWSPCVWWAPGVGITCSPNHSAPGQGWDVFSPSLSQQNAWLEVLLARQQLLPSQYPFSIKFHI